MEHRQSPPGSPLAEAARRLDPFGIVDSCAQVQQAWWRHPRELAERLERLGMDLSDLQFMAWQRFWGLRADDAIPVKYYDERFQDPIWKENPFYDLLKEYYLLYTHWLEDAIFQTPDLTDKTRRKAAFWVRQYLNAVSPDNFFWTNPLAIWRWITSGGQSLADGLRLWMEDAAKGDITMVGEDAFQVGRDLAVTPGGVVFRNELLEMIQYSPTTPEVHATPILIVAPWINKYYILDLNPQKSLVRYLVDRGFTVFVTSWRNPGPELRDTGMDDYMLNGVLKAVEAARAISGADQIHAVGYCIGGTLLAALMAWLNREPKAKSQLPIAHWTLFTGLVDFGQPGDIDVFIDEESVAYLEEKMARSGYLDGSEMAWSFRMLRSNSLIWRYVVHNYMYGEEPPPFDVLYWNTDCTRLPETMHSFYLREFYLANKMARPDALTLGGRPIDLGRIGQPLYAVGTEQDHIAPWKETFKVCSLVKAPVRYTLATSGHILGIISPPVDPPKRRYWTGDASGQTDPEAWQEAVDKRPGSWWEDWIAWLAERNGKRIPAPAALGSGDYPVLAPAPGTYVLEK